MTAAYKSPTPAQVDEVLRRIPTLPLRRAFFEGLKNPLWVEPLATAGMFSNPPEPEITSDGLKRDHYWPEIDYLTRVAPSTPTSVVDILLKLVDSNNAWVRAAVFRIGASIPANEAARLKPLLNSWGVAGFGWRTDPREMVAFTVNLLEGGQPKAGKWVANLLFRPRQSENRHKPDLTLDDYWYEECLPQVVEALGEEGLKTVLPWLEEFERHSGNLTDAFDMTYISRESISHERERLSSTEHALIDTVRDLASKEMATDPRAAKTVLTNSPMALARKITLHAAAEALKTGGGQGTNGSSGLLTVAQELLGNDDYRDDSCRIEFCELAREVATHSPAALEPLVEFIQAGPQIEMDELRKRLGSMHQEDTPDELQERVEEIALTWKHRWLSGIGSKALPAQLKTDLAELDQRRGPIDAPLAPLHMMTSWVGPNSPISQEEMSVMSPAELVAHLESWHATGSGWGPEPSHEGQGRELSALITTNPKILDSVDGLLDQFRPTYLRAILQGWDAAIKAGLELHWERAVDLIRGVLTHSDTSSFPQEGGDFDDDVDFRGAKKAAVNLLEELVKKRESPSIPHEVVRIYAELLIAEADEETAWTDYDSDDLESGMDPLMLSLNNRWPIRIHGLLNLMAHGKDSSWYETARSAFQRSIEKPDRQGSSRAVLGGGLGRLLTVDSDWIRPKIPELFGTAGGLSRNQQIALTTATASHRYHPELYNLLAQSMIAAIHSSEPLVAGWKERSDPLQRIGEWAIYAIIFGHKPIDNPVAEAFFAKADPKVRGQAIGRVAWSMINAELVDDAIRDRLAHLWDTRVEHVRSHREDGLELNEFHWFIKCKKFNALWWLPRLKEAVELNPELAKERFMIGKQIASSADLDPRGALEATRTLLEGREEAGVQAWDLARNAVPMVIARAHNSGDQQLKIDAIRFMNELGEKGYPELEKEVNEVLNGTITQDDVDEL